MCSSDLVSEHPLDCDGCPADGHCELQNMAKLHGVTHNVFSADARCSERITHESKARVKALMTDDSNPYFSFDPSLCIACSRCVRACDETQGTLALTISGRGLASQVSASAGESFINSECVSCGACVEACPTAALSEKSIAALAKPAERSVTTTCAYCGVGCSLKAEVVDGQDEIGIEVSRQVRIGEIRCPPANLLLAATAHESQRSLRHRHRQVGQLDVIPRRHFASSALEGPGLLELLDADRGGEISQVILEARRDDVVMPSRLG